MLIFLLVAQYDVKEIAYFNKVSAVTVITGAIPTCSLKSTMLE